MPLDHIPGDLGRVTGGEIIRHAETRLDRIEVPGLDHVRLEPGFLQVLNPADAAAAIRVAIDGYLVLRRPRGLDLEGRSTPDDGKDPPSRQRFIGHGLFLSISVDDQALA